MQIHNSHQLTGPSGNSIGQKITAGVTGESGDGSASLTKFLGKEVTGPLGNTAQKFGFVKTELDDSGTLTRTLGLGATGPQGNTGVATGSRAFSLDTTGDGIPALKIDTKLSGPLGNELDFSRVIDVGVKATENSITATRNDTFTGPMGESMTLTREKGVSAGSPPFDF